MSGYGGATASSSKNQSLSNSAFKEELAPEQIYALQHLWNRAMNLFDVTRGQMSDRLADTVLPQQARVFNAAMPAWEQMMQGGAYSTLDPDRVYESIYSSMGKATQAANQFAKSQTKQGKQLMKRTNKQRLNQNKKAGKMVGKY